MHFVFSVFLAFSLSILEAQDLPMDVWHEGELDVAGGKTLRGKIKYDLEAESVQYLKGSTLKTFSATNIDAFQIVDGTDGRVRYFYSLPYTYQNQYAKKHFFELLTEGYYTLLAREKLVERVRNVSDPFNPVGFNTYRVVFLEYDFFLVDQKGNIRPIDGNRPKDVIEYFDGKSEVLSDYIKENRLKLEEYADMTILVNYYNSLKG